MEGYELQQFVMVSPEVWQDLHLRYTQMLWPWWLLLILCSALVLVKRMQSVFFTYVAFSWMLIGGLYFYHFVREVHTFATVMACGFIFQGFVLLYCKVLLAPMVSTEKYSAFQKIALAAFGFAALVPYSYFLENSKQSILLFGWGAEQTALGTFALVLATLRSKIELLLIFIPLVWLGFYWLAL